MFNLLYNPLTAVHVVLTEGVCPAVLHNPVGQGLQDPGHQPLPLSLTHLVNKERWGVSGLARCYEKYHLNIPEAVVHVTEELPLGQGDQEADGLLPGHH